MISLAKLIYVILDIFTWVTIGSAIMSWLVAFGVVNVRNQLIRTLVDFLYRVTEPVLRPIRRVLPNLGGTLPNEVFTDILGLPTVWVPHSYAACSQHAPNEQLLATIVRLRLASKPNDLQRCELLQHCQKRLGCRNRYAR